MKNTVPKQHTPSEPTPIVIDAARAIELMQHVVTEVGYDHIYDGPTLASALGSDGCRYVDDDGGACCLVGRALVLAGVPAKVLAEYEGLDSHALVAQLWSRDLIRTNGLAATVFSRAQGSQDAMQPWGRALAEARAAVS